MDQKTYLTERIDDQINWYSQKSKTFQQQYKLLKVVVIISSVTIPFLVGFINSENDTWLKITAGILGVLVAAIEAILSLYKFKDLWLQYRITAETLQREKILYLTQAGPYQAIDDRFTLFVNRAENIMSAENQIWLQGQNKEEQPNDSSANT